VAEIGVLSPSSLSEGRSMLIVRTTTSSGSMERSCFHRRVPMSQIGVSSEFTMFRMRMEPSE
jgi:hypothetical protein